MKNVRLDANTISRATGCLLGQIAGDSLGSLVEFQCPEEILDAYPDGVSELADGGTWGTLAGQPTDDSEMALALARTLVRLGRYDANEVRSAYVAWLDSEPFDRGGTISRALRGEMSPSSQANGALMRISPVGIFGAGQDLQDVARWATEDAGITHCHSVCLEVNELFAMALALSIKTGPEQEALYQQILTWAKKRHVSQSVLDAILAAAEAPHEDFTNLQGWVLIAFRNALFQLVHAESLEAGVVDTVMRGGDTDTNAAICGALLGAVYGREAIPRQWQACIRNCMPDEKRPNVYQPRPEIYWPGDTVELAEKLLRLGWTHESAQPGDLSI